VRPPACHLRVRVALLDVCRPRALLLMMASSRCCSLSIEFIHRIG
jgi:hypothetical protein